MKNSKSFECGSSSLSIQKFFSFAPEELQY